MQHLKPRYPLTEGFQLLGLSRSKGYLRIRDGQLKVLRDGDTNYITADEIDRYAAQSHPKVDYTLRTARPKMADKPPPPKLTRQKRTRSAAAP